MRLTNRLPFGDTIWVRLLKIGRLTFLDARQARFVRQASVLMVLVGNYMELYGDSDNDNEDV